MFLMMMMMMMGIRAADVESPEPPHRVALREQHRVVGLADGLIRLPREIRGAALIPTPATQVH